MPAPPSEKTSPRRRRLPMPSTTLMSELELLKLIQSSLGKAARGEEVTPVAFGPVMGFTTLKIP
jgi:hypothetical protein